MVEDPLARLRAIRNAREEAAQAYQNLTSAVHAEAARALQTIPGITRKAVRDAGGYTNFAALSTATGRLGVRPKTLKTAPELLADELTTAVSEGRWVPTDTGVSEVMVVIKQLRGAKKSANKSVVEAALGILRARGVLASTERSPAEKTADDVLVAIRAVQWSVGDTITVDDLAEMIRRISGDTPQRETLDAVVEVLVNKRAISRPNVVGMTRLLAEAAPDQVVDNDPEALLIEATRHADTTLVALRELIHDSTA